MGQRLLLVDSDRSFLKEHKVSLEAAFDLEVVSSPDGVPERLAGGGYAAVLICVEVGDNKGYALCSTLRRQAALAGLKIALISAKATEEEYRRHQSLKGRADLYLRKPIAPSALVAALSPLVPGRAVDPDNPLGDLGDLEPADDWFESLKGSAAPAAPAPEPVRAAPDPLPPPVPAPTSAPGRATRPPDTTRAHLLEEQVVALREELRVRDQQLREAEEYLQQRIGAATLNLDDLATREQELAAAQAETREARDQAHRLQQELEGLRTARSSHDQELAELRGRLKQVEAELAASHAQTLERESRLQACQEELQEREKENRRLASQAASLRQQVDEATVQHDGERLEMMSELDRKEAELVRLTQAMAELRDTHAILEREKQAVYGQLSDHRDRLRSLDALLREVQDQLRRGSDLARG